MPSTAPKSLTPNQVQWASEHDWFIRDNGDGTITCADRYSDGSEQLVKHDNFQTLREWAGY